MLEHPIVMRRLSFKMTHSKWEVSLLDRFVFTFASDPHNASRGRAQQFPFTMFHRIEVDLPEKGLRQPREFGECLWVHLTRHNPSGFCTG